MKLTKSTTGDLVCLQVSDFGLTVNAYTANYKYVVGGPKPIRYLSPEALKRGRYSEKSDVWAFGVTAWELFTNGMIPYWNISDDDGVIAHVTAGNVLATPEDPELLSLWEMLQGPCFANRPTDRPTFAELGVVLAQNRSAKADPVAVPPSGAHAVPEVIEPVESAESIGLKYTGNLTEEVCDDVATGKISEASLKNSKSLLRTLVDALKSPSCRLSHLKYVSPRLSASRFCYRRGNNRSFLILLPPSISA